MTGVQTCALPIYTRPGGGVGLRFTVAPKNHINIKADYGLGQGSHAWYVGIGEAF